jgi:RHS repeat-associated protein
MTGSGFKIQPDDLHGSGSTLESFGNQVAQGGAKLQTVGQNLVSHASSDKSGVGKVITDALGKGTEVAGKVFSEGGRVAGAAGKRLHSNASAHSANEEAQTSAFRSLHDKPADSGAKPKSVSGGGGKPGGTPKGSPGGSDGGSGSHQGGFNDKGDQPKKIGDENSEPNQNDKPTKDAPTEGDPVDVATGRMLLQQTDVDLPASLPLVVSRTHLSHYRLGRSFGAGWASTLDQRVEVDADAVNFAAEDGMLLSYPTPVTDDGVLPLTGPRLPLYPDGNGGYAIVNHELDQVWHFGPNGSAELPISAILDGNGDRVDIDRDAVGTPTAIRHSSGYRITVHSVDRLVSSLSLDDGADGVTLASYRYDERRRLVEVVNSTGQPLRFEYDESDRVVRWDDRNGMWYRYEFDANGRCVRSEGKDGYLNCEFEYDRDNRRTRVTNSLGGVVEYQLDEQLRVIARTDPLGNTTRSTWDENGRLAATTDPLGRVTGFRYNEYGDLVTTTNPDGTQVLVEYNQNRRPVTVVNEDGAVWRREFDQADRMLAEIDPTGARTTYAYSDAGYLTSVTDALGHLTRIEVDPAGLPLAVTDPTGNTTRYDYDRFGRMTTVTDPLGGVTTMVWTVEGKPLRRVLPDGAVERWNYDGEGNLREAVDPQGNITRTDVGHFDKPVTEIRPDGTTLTLGYDTELRLASVTNEQGLVWRYEYDAAGNLVAETDFNGRTRAYRHDAAGQLVEQTDGTGQTTRFAYDALGRLVRRESSDEISMFGYDPIGRILMARNADAEVVYSYDHAGRPLTETINGRMVASAYDLVGRRIGRRTPSGSESVWEYDPNSRPTALHAAGRTIRFGYDAAGREIERHLGTNVLLAQAWDPNDRLTAQSVLVGGRSAASRAYRYLPDGFLSGVDDQLTGPRRYELDPVGRVTGVHGAGWAERYSYDRAGNMVGADWPAAEPDDLGRREYTGTLIRRAGTVRYEHDAEGRIVLRQRKTLSARPQTWRYTWNSQNRLVAVRTPDGQQWQYRYDAFGRRIAKQRLAPGGVGVLEQVDFSWDGIELVEQVHNQTRAVVWDWDPGNYRAVSQVQRTALRDAPQQWVDQQFHAIVTDLVGTPTELVDADGNLSVQPRQTLWGASAAGMGDTPLRFPGQYHDPETGLHYNLQRYYDPVAGRYASMDPLGLTPSPNPQAYVPNPTAWIDPNGLMPDCPQKKTTVYRVEVPPVLDASGNKVRGKEGNILLDIDDKGNVQIKNKMTYLNFGSAARANEYLQKRFDQGAPLAKIKSFEVPSSYVDDIRNQAVSEADIKKLDPGRTRPVIADPTKADDQFGIRPNMLPDLRKNIIPGSGKVWPGFVPDNE